MEGLVQYLISIMAAAIICGIAKVVSDEKTAAGAMTRLVAGLIMAFTVIAPLVQMELGELPVLSSQILTDAENLSARGEEMAEVEANSIIMDELEAYILDKAASYGADVDVELRLLEYQPTEIIVRGSVLPGTRQKLQQMLETDLGIPKENQQWIQ